MQAVNYFIMEPQLGNWRQVVEKFEESGIKINFELTPTKTTVVLSGAHLNPMMVSGRKILIAHSREWGALWKSVYRPVLEEYYDHVINIGGMSLEEAIKTVGEYIED